MSISNDLINFVALADYIKYYFVLIVLVEEISHKETCKLLIKLISNLSLFILSTNLLKKMILDEF